MILPVPFGNVLPALTIVNRRDDRLDRPSSTSVTYKSGGRATIIALALPPSSEWRVCLIEYETCHSTLR
jgi:hypothetical protein